MRKISISVMMIAMISLSAQAQKLSSAKVPAAVKNAFSKQYPGTAVKWELEDGKYEASFKQGTSSTSVMYNKDGTVFETEVDIKPAELPASVSAYVKQHYPGKSIKEASKITKADGAVNYEARVNGKDVIFDASGNFLKEDKD